MRTEGDFIKIHEWLTPLSWLYGLGVGFRNLLFKLGILKSRHSTYPLFRWETSLLGAQERHRMWNISCRCSKTK